MATRHLTWPQTLAPAMNTLGFNLVHNADRTNTLGGKSYVRDYWQRSKERYEAIYRPRRENDHEVEICLDITERMHGTAVPVWIPEPLPRHHRRRLCGLGDGSTLAFPVPMWNQASAPHIMIGSAEQTVAGWSQYANLLTDDEAAMIESITGLSAFGPTAPTLTRDDAQAYFGRYSCKVNNPTSQSVYGAETGQKSISSGVDYGAIAWVAGEIPSAKIELYWYDSGGLPITSVISTTTTVGDEWTALEIFGTAPTGPVAFFANVRVFCDVTSDKDFWVDCISLTPLESADWWLPSLSPGVARLSTAPAADDRVEATGSGQAIVQCAAVKNQVGRSADAIGNITIPRITFEELWPNG